MPIRFPPCLILVVTLVWTGVTAAPQPLRYQDSFIELDGQRYPVRIPQGYVFELLTSALDGPRLMTFADNGDLFIGSQSGHVYRLPPPYTRPQSLIQLNDYPHSVALRGDNIFIAQNRGLYRADYKPGQTRIDAKRLHKIADIPGGRGHSSRSVRVGPDDRIYLSLGITGNCSDEYLDDSYDFSERRGGVMVLDETVDPPRWQTFASGLRNPVGFDWHPQTGTLYASNNGPDHQGFEQPPDDAARDN